MTRLAILGPGLLGGSCALAARRAGGFHVSAWARRPEAVSEMENTALADVVSTELPRVVEGADLIVLCVPIGAMSAIARQIAPLISEPTIVTDVGSVKTPVVAELGRIFAGRGRFIGSHPMAGSDQTGLVAARADLFDGAACVVTPDASSDPDAVASVQRFWGNLGARVLLRTPAEHDELVALISHLPHLLAATLVNVVGETQPAAFDLAGPGFRDTTRVASGPPAMWAEILRSNQQAVRAAAEAMIEKLREITTLLDHDAPMTGFLTQAKAWRDPLRLPKTPHA